MQIFLVVLVSLGQWSVYGPQELHVAKMRNEAKDDNDLFEFVNPRTVVDGGNLLYFIVR
jgi:hypothetical protein